MKTFNEYLTEGAGPVEINKSRAYETKNAVSEKEAVKSYLKVNGKPKKPVVLMTFKFALEKTIPYASAHNRELSHAFKHFRGEIEQIKKDAAYFGWRSLEVSNAQLKKWEWGVEVYTIFGYDYNLTEVHKNLYVLIPSNPVKSLLSKTF